MNKNDILFVLGQMKRDIEITLETLDSRNGIFDILDKRVIALDLAMKIIERCDNIERR